MVTTNHNCSKEEEFAQILVKQAKTEEKQKTYNQDISDINKKVGWFLTSFVALMCATIVAISIAAYNFGAYNNTLQTAIKDISSIADDLDEMKEDVDVMKTDIFVLKQTISQK